MHASQALQPRHKQDPCVPALPGSHHRERRGEPHVRGRVDIKHAAGCDYVTCTRFSRVSALSLCDRARDRATRQAWSAGRHVVAITRYAASQWSQRWSHSHHPNEGVPTLHAEKRSTEMCVAWGPSNPMDPSYYIMEIPMISRGRYQIYVLAAHRAQGVGGGGAERGGFSHVIARLNSPHMITC